jgi:hypothetical protein
MIYLICFSSFYDDTLGDHYWRRFQQYCERATRLAPFASYFGPKEYKRCGFAYHEEEVGLARVGRAGDLDDVARAERRAVQWRREGDGGPRGE